MFPELDERDRAAREAEFFPTREGWPVRGLIETADPPFRFDLVAEHAAGEGHIVRHVLACVPAAKRWVLVELRPDAAERAGNVARDLGLSAHISVGDFLAGAGGDMTAVTLAITNPSFSIAAAYLAESVRRMPRADIALLVRQGFFSSGERKALLRDLPIDRYDLAERPSFKGDGTDLYDYSWAVTGPGRGGRWYQISREPAAPVRCVACCLDVRGACGILLPDGGRCALPRGHRSLEGTTGRRVEHWDLCGACASAELAAPSVGQEGAPEMAEEPSRCERYVNVAARYDVRECDLPMGHEGECSSSGPAAFGEKMPEEMRRAFAEALDPRRGASNNTSDPVVVRYQVSEEVRRRFFGDPPAEPSPAELEADARALARSEELDAAYEHEVQVMADPPRCPGASGEQRCKREQGHPGRCFDGTRIFVDGDPPVLREASYAESRAMAREVEARAPAPVIAASAWRCAMCQCSGEVCDLGHGRACEIEGDICSGCAIAVEDTRCATVFARERGEALTLEALEEHLAASAGLVFDRSVLVEALARAAAIVDAAEAREAGPVASKKPRTPRKPRARVGAFEPTCDICRCTERQPCKDEEGALCCWANVERTRCLWCAEVVEIVRALAARGVPWSEVPDALEREDRASEGSDKDAIRCVRAVRLVQAGLDAAPPRVNAGPHVTEDQRSHVENIPVTGHISPVGVRQHSEKRRGSGSNAPKRETPASSWERRGSARRVTRGTPATASEPKPAASGAGTSIRKRGRNGMIAGENARDLGTRSNSGEETPGRVNPEDSGPSAPPCEQRGTENEKTHSDGGADAQGAKGSPSPDGVNDGSRAPDSDAFPWEGPGGAKGGA